MGIGTGDEWQGCMIKGNITYTRLKVCAHQTKIEVLVSLDSDNAAIVTVATVAAGVHGNLSSTGVGATIEAGRRRRLFGWRVGGRRVLSLGRLWRLITIAVAALLASTVLSSAGHGDGE